MDSSGNHRSAAMEKHQFLNVSQASFVTPELGIDTKAPERQRTRCLHHFFLGLVLFVVLIRWRISGGAPSHMGPNVDSTVFDWYAHPPSKNLNWTECYERFQCARLTVPLLYSEASGEQGAVALIKSPSKYPPGHENYRGPILFNPGGPGGSGTELLLLAESSFRVILSDEFDLVGFDPRGVGFTTPELSVFQDQVEASRFFLQFPLNLNTSASALGDAYAKAQILGNIVADRSKYVAERVSTPLVARDMLSIVQAFGQDKLQYWGFSYGTILGATFATMFPDNVGRLVIDGVVDTEDYYAGAWTNNLRDTDKGLLDIYQSCVNAGPSRCPIYENTAAQVQARVDRLLGKLRTEPAVFYDNSTSSPGADYEVVDYALVRNAILTLLYATHTYGALLASALAALERGDPSDLYMFSAKRAFNSLAECNCPAPGEGPPVFQAFYETTYSIACGDSGDREDNLDTLRKDYENMAGLSSFADSWPHHVFCAGWKLSSKERFNGSFEQTTSHPLLLIGNVADPVTPIWNAHKVSKGFKDSVVLTQNSSGHCSIAATSLCTFKAVREYFVNGTLPEPGTVCDTQSSIFGEKEFELEALSAEDKELVEASQVLQENYFVPVLGGGRILMPDSI